MRILTIANDNSGQVLCFPQHAATVRRTAEAANDRHGIAADRYWRSMITDMRARMVATGVPEEAVECELRAFSDSVFSMIGERCA
jgi:hypothetical protein